MTAAYAPRKVRAGDTRPFYSSHKECYLLGIHDNSTDGREQCRYQPRIVVVDDQRPAAQIALRTYNVKSPISPNVHAQTDSGTVCGIKLAKSEQVDSTDFPVTCKSCLKRSA